jgi:hypothetical protein
LPKAQDALVEFQNLVVQRESHLGLIIHADSQRGRSVPFEHTLRLLAQRCVRLLDATHADYPALLTALSLPAHQGHALAWLDLPNSHLFAIPRLASLAQIEVFHQVVSDVANRYQGKIEQ